MIRNKDDRRTFFPYNRNMTRTLPDRTRRRRNQFLITVLSALLLICLRKTPAQSENFVQVQFALVCPFATISDTLSPYGLNRLWRHGKIVNREIETLYIDPAALTAFKMKFGEADPKSVRSSPNPIRQVRTHGGGSCALIPIVDIAPDLKRIRLGVQPAPWDDEYDANADPLILTVSREDPLAEKALKRDRISRVLLTGTTALARNTAYALAQHGTDWTAEAIRETFAAADLRHISNESSFWKLCPEPRPSFTMQFCTPYESWRLFETLGVNCVELSGNHLRDYDWPPLLETFELLEREKIRYYAAGRTVEDAARPLEISHNGNDFVFIGCNSAGPEHVFASDTLPGVNRCDFEQLESEIRKLEAEGKIVIVTLQYGEAYSRTPGPYQQRDFLRISRAGAAVVSGSQSHIAQTYAVAPDRIVHYGLGNLFFDQMDRPVVGTRQETLDRHIFYRGRLLQTETITALLTDYAKPVLMTPDERAELLKILLPLSETFDPAAEH